MAKCAICEKGVHYGNNVSHSHRRSNHVWKSNIKKVSCKVNGVPQKLYVCTSCLRSGKVERAQSLFLNLLNFKGHPFGCPFYLLTYMKLILLVVLCLIYLYIVEIKVIIFPLREAAYNVRHHIKYLGHTVLILYIDKLCLSVMNN